MPPPPEAPEWVEPVPLTRQLTVETQTCDEGQPDSPTWTTEWSDRAQLRLHGFVEHNGAERVEAQSVKAWQVGDRLVVSYEVKGNDFPESPVMACNAWTRVDILFPGLSIRPTKISIYGSQPTQGLEATARIPPR